MFTLSISIILDFISSLLLPLFLDTINSFSGKKKDLLLFNWIFSRYFRCQIDFRRGGSNVFKGSVGRKYST